MINIKSIIIDTDVVNSLKEKIRYKEISDKAWASIWKLEDEFFNPTKKCFNLKTYVDDAYYWLELNVDDFIKCLLSTNKKMS